MSIASKLKIIAENEEKIKGLVGDNTLKKLLDTTLSADYLFARNNFYKIPYLDAETIEQLIQPSDTKNVLQMDSMFDHQEELIRGPQLNTQNVYTMSRMFASCAALKEVPVYDTSKVTSMNEMFYFCKSLESAPAFNTCMVYAQKMFGYCSSLRTIPLYNTSRVQNFREMFYSCNSLEVIPALDMRNATNVTSMLYGCSSMKECWIRNIQISLQVGSGTTYGHLLTVDSLVHLCYELCDTGSQKTLTVGSANLEKLATVYVKAIDITDEMRAEDDLVDEKLPFVVCESTDEGATLIADYIKFKNWVLK